MPRRQYPIRMDLKEVEKRTAARDAAAEERRLRERFGSIRDALGRARRVQGEEAGEREVMRNKKGGKVMKTKKYAKGGPIDGCATKGKTRAKMVKMAAGGVAGKPAMTGLARAADVSGRAMPTNAGTDARGRALSARPMRKGGMTKGCK